MRYFLLTLALAFTSLYATGCSDNPAVNEPAPYVDTTIVSNGFRVEGDGYRDAPFALPSQAVALSTGNGWSSIIQFSHAFRPGRSPERVLMVVRIPERRGSFPWADLIAQPTDTANAHLIIEIEGKRYVSVEGSTSVVFFRDVSPNTTAGTFQGTLRSAFGDTIVVTGGRFDGEFSQP